MLRAVSEDVLDPQERSCCICYQPFGPKLSQGPEAPVQLPCGHVFGRTCILRWTLTNRSCPLCRRDVFETDDHHSNHYFSSIHNSNTDSFMVAPQDDVWLDAYVWGVHTEDRFQDPGLNITDRERVAEVHANDRSDIHLGFQPSASPEIQICAENCGLCLCFGEENTSISASSYEHFIEPLTAQYMQADRDYSDLSQVGSQSADLGCYYKQWINEYLDELSFDEDFFVYRKI